MPATEETKTFPCLYCSRRLFTSQDHGGHWNALKKETATARRSFPTETSAAAASLPSTAVSIAADAGPPLPRLFLLIRR
ncbi:hypothetical protein QJS10_CPB20g01751 [Acorus calamus]|uniref:Uncharacterized protein n=1 Tax=Acorus calamus TaxID=4465 RepID=A0AAV9CDD7_ACOCL|nr:hypothetical protein QJS10_CPB20g01751 [Acorus calamus]